jgi:glycosyltransferase involved in cell wall biosynthesis
MAGGRSDTRVRIGIASEWIGQRVGGPERYAREIIEHVVRLGSQHDYRLYVTASARDLLRNLEGPRVRLCASRSNSRAYFIPVGLPLNALVGRLDLLHATFSYPPWCPVKHVVLTVHDVSVDTAADMFDARTRRRVRWALKHGIARAALVLVPTEATRRELLQGYEISADRVKVVPYGIDHRAVRDEPADAAPLAAPVDLGRGFILYVGRFHARKNLDRLLDAYAQSRARSRGRIPLVLAGKDFGHLDTIRGRIRSLGLEDRVWCPGHVSDDVLESLYRRALLFVYPSIHEGFGFPPLEAMARHVPVVASNVSAMPEVLGDGARLVDPHDSSQMAAAIDGLLENDGERSLLADRGAARAQTFTWARTAQLTLDAYHEVMARRA